MSSDDASQVEMRFDERQGSRVAVVTINNASRLNAMHSALMDEFVERLSPLMADAQLRGFVLTGAGDKAFIGGADIREMSALANAEDGREFITRLHPGADDRPHQRLGVGGRARNGRCLRRAHRSGERGVRHAGGQAWHSFRH
jgi:enoyl-CoA hydratase/carnithine racemase